MPSVLIVENNDFFRRSFKEILKMYIPTLSVEESADGSDALAKVDQGSPDVIFMDIRLPGEKRPRVDPGDQRPSPKRRDKHLHEL